MINGTSATHRHYVGEFPGLKYTTICDWRKAISEQQQKEHEAVTELHGKKRGRPPTLPDKVATYVMKYIHAVQWRRKLSKSGGTNLLNKNYFYGKNLNPMEHSQNQVGLQPHSPTLSAAYGAVRDARGVINTAIVTVKKERAKYLLSKMKFVKRKASTKKSAMITVSNFDDNFLMDIKAVVVKEEVPDDMILNWNQTTIKYIPVSNWTMTIEGSKRIVD